VRKEFRGLVQELPLFKFLWWLCITTEITLTRSRTVPWLLWMVIVLSPQRPGFDHKVFRVRFMMAVVLLGHVFLQVGRLFPVSFIPLMLLVICLSL